MRMIFPSTPVPILYRTYKLRINLWPDRLQIMLVRLGALRKTKRLPTSIVQKRSISTSNVRLALYGRLPLVPIESIDSHKGNCIPLLPDWEPVPLAYRLKQHRFHPVAIRRELKHVRFVSIKYIAHAMEVAAEKGLLNFAVANSFLGTIKQIEKYRFASLDCY
jgi:hypothetical protein